MFVYQDGKLYVQSGNKLVWVEIYPDLNFTITEQVVKRKATARNLTNMEVKCKFHLNSLVPIEPRVEKPKATRKPRTKKVEVTANESTDNTTKSTGKRTAK